MAENMIKLGVKLDISNTEKELQELLQKVGKDQKIKVDIDFGKSVESLKQLSSNLNKIQAEMSKFKIGGNGDLGAEKITQNIKKFESVITSMQNKLNTTKANGFIDSNVITELQNKLNSINTNTSQKQIKDLQNTIKNLASNDSSIVRLQNAITKFSSTYDGIKNKMDKGSLLGNDQTELKLKQYESELNKLKSLQSQLENGKSFSGTKVTSEINSMTNASRQLNSTLQSNIKTSESFGSSIKNALSNMGLYVSAYQGIQMTINAIKEGIGTVISMDTSLGNLNKVVSMSKEELLQMRDSAVQMGKELGRSSIEVANAQAEFGRLYKTQDEINAMTKTSLMGANVMDGVSADQVAKSLTTIITSMKMEAKDSMTVLDSMNEIQNNYRISASDLSEALAEVGSTAYTSGASLQQVEGYITSIATATGESGSEVGTALRTIMSRVYSIGRDGIEAAGLPEKILKQVGVAVRDESGQFRDFSKILENLSGKWSTLSKTEQIAVAQKVAGVQRYNQFLALMQNYGTAVDATTTALNSQGSASKENEIHMSTASAKIGVLKASLEELWYKMINSDTIKSAIDGLTSLVNALSNVDGSTVKIIATFTALGLALKSVATFSTALKGVETIANLGKNAGLLGGLVKGFSGLGTSIGGAVTALKFLAFTPVGLAISGLTVAIGGAIATYETYQELISKPIATTPTENLSEFEQVINSLTGSVYKSKKELQEAGLIYEDFGDGISDGFKEGIVKATETYHDFEMELTGSNSGDKISNETSAKMKSSIDKMITDAKNTVMSRKTEVQNELSKMFTLGDGKIDESEQKVIDSIGSEANIKFDKIAEIHEKVYKIWNDAITAHGKLSQDDIKQIQDYMAQVQQIKAEAEAKNTAESNYAKNQYSERLNGMSAEDASAEYIKASKDLKTNFADARATYTTGMDELATKNEQLLKEQATAHNEGNAEREKALQSQIEGNKKQIDAKKDEYDGLIETEKTKRREYLDLLYEKNPDLQNNMNEIDGTMFSKPDTDAQGRKEKLRKEFSELSNVTKTGMVSVKKQVSDGNGGFKDEWHDVYVTFDEATGNITGEYDTFTGEYGGYSQKFEEQVKADGSKIKASMEELQKSLMFNGGGVKIDSKNNAINSTTDELITKLDTVVEKSDGAKTAIQNINGSKIRLEFDKNGTLTNAQEVQDAIAGELKDNPAVVKTKIEIDGTETSTIDSTVKKLKDLPKEQKVRININGEEVIVTAEEAKKKLKEIPPDKDVDIKVETDEAKINAIKGKIDALPDKKECKVSVDGTEETNVDSIYKKLSELPPETEVDIVINGEQITTAGEAKAKLEAIPTETNTDVVVNTGDANANIDTTQGKVDTLDGDSANVNVSESGAEQSTGKINETGGAIDGIDGKTANTQVNADTAQANSNISTFSSWWSGLLSSSSVITKTINVFKNIFGGVDDTEATGTNKAPGGRTLLAEEGMELLVEPQVRKLKGGETVLNNKSTKNYLEALRLRDKEKENIGHNASGTDNWRGGLTYINEDEEGELVNLPNGTQIIPHDLSKKIIEENARKNSGNVTVNKIDVYQGIDNGSNLNDYYQGKGKGSILDVSKANLNKAYVPEPDTDNMSESEKKAYEAKKKAQENEEKRLKDKIDKEKQYLDDIGNAWENNERRVTNSIDEIELKEAEFGDDIGYTDKIDLLNQKYQKQLSLLPIAEKQLNTYKTTIVSTEEAQKELADKIQDATKTVNSQKKAIVDAYNDIKKANEEMIKSNEDTANSFRDKLVDSLREDLNKQKQDKIDKLNEELKSLDDESADKQNKLKALQNEKMLWGKDNSAFGQKKV